jgi:exodeoxyribonuclease VII large subunit
VVIIRGGGATSDLSCFDTYALAANCAQYPLPIITGIGHERDDTVIDSVAHTRVKTPTAAAEFLIAHQLQAAEAVEALAARMRDALVGRLEEQQRRLQRLMERLPLQVKMRLQAENHERIALRLENSVKTLMLKQQHRLELIQNQLKAASPEHLLKLGYSITLKDGHAVTDASQLQPGDLLTTRLWHGTAVSKVQ